MPSRATQHGTIAVGLPSGATDSGVYQTSPGLLRRRALGPWAEGLSQYLAIRVGDAARGRAAFRSLSRLLTSLPPEELLVAPGPKAQLYRIARSIAETERAMPGPAPSGNLPWREDGGGHARVLGRLREELGTDESELLELRHARELSVEEIACVVEMPIDEVELALDTAEARARQILGRHAPDPLSPSATVYVEAFALARSWQDLDAAPDDLVEVEDALELGTLIGGRYQLLERVGTGAFGDVYRAEDVEVPGHQVAVKVLRTPSLSESARQSALRELKLNAAVFHPSLVQFKDHGWFEQRLWFVMPWYQGETLEARIRRGALSRVEARRIFEPLARALAALHEAGIRHQDIKPENILLTRLPGYGPDTATEDGDGILPVLIDLGVAAKEQETLLGGTPLYFAPEVAARFVDHGHEGPDVGSAADVFALALSLRNALEPGTQEDVAAGAIRAFVEHRATDMPPMPEARDLRYLRPTLRRWLSGDPLDRPSAVELAGALAILTAPEEARDRRIRLVRWLLPLLLTLGTVFAAVVYFLDHRAAMRELEARRAQAAAADARADLIVADARRRSVEEGHAELLDRYEQSRMSRRDLARQLATSEGQLRILGGELSSAIDTRTDLRDQLGAARRELRERASELEAVARARDEAGARVDRLGRDLERTRAEADGLRRDLDSTRGRADRLGSELASVRTDAQRAHDRADALAAELSEAQQARVSAESELARVQRQIRSLAATLRATEPPDAPDQPVGATAETTEAPAAPAE